jgi:hypothetical protein
LNEEKKKISALFGEYVKKILSENGNDSPKGSTSLFVVVPFLVVVLSKHTKPMLSALVF